MSRALPDSSVVGPAEIPAAWALLTQVLVCLLGSAILLAIWYKGEPLRGGKERPRTTKRDPAVLWFSSAIFLWALSPALVLGLGTAGYLQPVGLSYLRVIGSTLNSACFLLAVAHFDYGPRVLASLQFDRRWWAGLGLVVLLVAGLVVGLAPRVPHEQVALAPDVAFSTIVIAFLGVGFFRSFDERGYGTLAALSVVPVVLLLISQFLEFLRTGEQLRALGHWRWAIPLASKSSFSMVFAALAFTWLSERFEEPEPGRKRLEFTHEVDAGGRRIVKIDLADGTGSRAIGLPTSAHAALLKFANARVEDALEGWVHIAEFPRHYHALKDICKRVGCEQPQLFENLYGGRYRLTIPAKAIELPSSKESPPDSPREDENRGQATARGDRPPPL